MSPEPTSKTEDKPPVRVRSEIRKFTRTFAQAASASSIASHFRLGTLSADTGGTLTVRSGGGTAGTSKVLTLSLTGTARLNLNDHATILQGAIPAAILALLVQSLFDFLDRVLIPKGLRL